MNYTVTAYSIYLPVAVALTVWVARTLYLNSRIFLVDIFHGQTELAVAVNKLLQVGFYLIGLGYAILNLKIQKEWDYDETMGRRVYEDYQSVQGTIEILS